MWSLPVVTRRNQRLKLINIYCRLQICTTQIDLLIDPLLTPKFMYILGCVRLEFLLYRIYDISYMTYVIVYMIEVRKDIRYALDP